MATPSSTLDARRIDRYLARIGLAGPRPTPSEATLVQLHRAHLLAVPFENTCIHAGEAIQLTPDWLYRKIVERRRGGFCYELNGLFAELLEGLGFQVDRLAARVFGKDGALGIPFDHMCLRVDRAWLADVGFGDSFVRPLRIDLREPQHDGRRAFRLVDDGPGACVLEDDGKPVYRLELGSHALADFEPGCHHHQTSPQSPFTRRRLASRLTERGRITLTDDRLIVTDEQTGRSETPVEDAEAWARLAVEHFGL